MTKLKKILERLSPPGAGYQQFVTFLGGGIFVSTLSSLWYFSNYSNHYYVSRYPVLSCIQPPEQMPPLRELLAPQGFLIFAAACVAFVIANYLYFFQESKSIYTMHRLRSPLELHLRCWALPVLGALALLAWGAICCCLYALHYFYATPAALIPSQAAPFWR